MAEVDASIPAENRMHIYSLDRQIKYLIDSGSVNTLFPKTVVKRMQLQPQAPSLNVAKPSSITPFGTGTMMLNLGFRRRYFWQFTVGRKTSN